MKKIFLASLVSASLALSGCTALGAIGTAASVATVAGARSPAPLQRVIIDDKAIRYAFLGYDTMLTLVDIAVEGKQLVPNSPRALQIKGYLVQIKYWLNAASAAQKAGSKERYDQAFAEASKAMALAKQAIEAR